MAIKNLQIANIPNGKTMWFYEYGTVLRNSCDKQMQMESLSIDCVNMIRCSFNVSQKNFFICVRHFQHVH